MNITFGNARSIDIAGFCGKGDSFYSSCPTVDTQPDYGYDDYEPQNAEASSRCEVDYGYGDEDACAPAAKKSPPLRCAGEEPKKESSNRRGAVTKYSLDGDGGETCAPAKTQYPSHCTRREPRKKPRANRRASDCGGKEPRKPRAIRRGSLTTYSLNGDGGEACSPANAESTPQRTAEEPRELRSIRCVLEPRKPRAARRGSLTTYHGDGVEACAPAKAESPPHCAGREPRKPRSIRRGSLTKYSLDGDGGEACTPLNKAKCSPQRTPEEPKDERSIHRGAVTKYSLDGDGGEACTPVKKADSPSQRTPEEPKEERSIRRGAVTKYSLDGDGGQPCVPAKAESPPHCAIGEQRKPRTIRRRR
jgi:hypothetical protein